MKYSFPYSRPPITSRATSPSRDQVVETGEHELRDVVQRTRAYRQGVATAL